MPQSKIAIQLLRTQPTNIQRRGTLRKSQKIPHFSHEGIKMSWDVNAARVVSLGQIRVPGLKAAFLLAINCVLAGGQF